MLLNITEDDLILNIQSDFHREYPWLRLVFHLHPHVAGDPSAAADVLDPLTPVDEIRMFHCAGKIDIDPKRSAADVEHDFFHFLGLSVQVMRRAGNSWLQTTATDNLSLGAQNERGRLSTLPAASGKSEEKFNDAG